MVPPLRRSDGCRTNLPLTEMKVTMAPNPNTEMRKAHSAEAVDCAKAATLTLPQLLYYVLTGEGSAFHGARAAKAV